MKESTKNILNCGRAIRDLCVGAGLALWVLAAGPAFAYEPGPQLVADYDRDGRISPTDRERALSGDEFTIWINDDDDAGGDGDTNNDLHDVPCGKDGEGNPNDKDCEDDQVNGRCDLLDFFPVLVNVREVADWEHLTWKLCSDNVNVVFTGLKADNAGSFHTNDVDDDNGTSLHKASVAKLTEDGVALLSGFLDEAGEGVFVIEGRKRGQRCLTLRGYKYDEVVAEVTMNLDVENVESLYGWMNLRGSQPSTFLPSTFQPFNSSSDNRHFVLVHGYNTNHEEARGNAAEFYKKLWQSGSDAMFTAVEWRGDQSQIKFDLLGVNFTPNYYVNVENAFLAARPFAEACAKLPGEKILVAHSLGNMLVASAIKDYGLDYTKFVMLNAAVAREAFDASAYDEDMVDEDWLGDERDEGGEKRDEGRGVDSLTNHLDRASRWYKNFAGKEYDPYEYRRKLNWCGRFADLPRTVNYYSQSDNMLVNPDPNEPDPDEVFDRDDLNLTRKVEELLAAKLVNGRSIGSGGSKKTGFGFWSFSEKMKGTWLLDAVNDVLTNVLEVAQADAYKREGGWGENEDYDDNPERPFDPANTRFTPFLDERLTEWGMLDILPAETERLRAQHLADAIPAESFAAGANPVAMLENVNEEDFIGANPDWPLYEGEEVHTNVWNHSAFREVAFYHTSKLYASLAAVGKPRVIIDTDLGSSMDDLFALDFAARMHKQGKLDLMGVMMDRPDNSDEEGRGEFLKFADRYLATLGFADLPLGKSSDLAEDRLPQHVFNPYWTLIYSNGVSGVGTLMPTNRTDAQLASLPNAVALYRRLLNDAPEKSVVICSIGFLNNLKALMESGGDYEGDGIHSTGLELIAAKVKELRIMGGCFEPESAPNGTGGAEYNLAGDPVAAKKVIEEWPTPVVVSPWEVGLNLDYKADEVLADFPVGTPDPVLRATYVYWPNPAHEGEMNRPWDLATLLPLAEGETLLPLSEKGEIAVDEKGITTFTPDASGTRRYQVAANMSTNAVLSRFHAIFRAGNPSVTLLVSGKPEPGVDYNGSELVFKFENLQFGSFAEEDLKFGFTIDGAEYAPESSEWDETLGVLSVRFVIPPDAVTAGNSYDGTLTVTLENDELGSVQLTTASRRLVQGVTDRDEPECWFDEYDLVAPTNYVPETQMPERATAIVEATFLFERPRPDNDEPPPKGAQTAARVVEDGDGGYKFQYYAFAGAANGEYYLKWHDFNVGGENVRELKPTVGQTYVLRMEGFYDEDARGEANTVVISVAQEGSNEGFLKQFVGNLINEEGELCGRTRLNSVGFAGEGTVYELRGEYCGNLVNANLARIDGDAEYATVADAVAATDGNPIRLLHAASWSPSMEDAGKAIRFLNRSLLVLDESNLPGNVRAVWTDVDGNSGTLTLELVFADTVVYGTIRTAEEENPVAEAIAVKDGKYVYVGDEAGAEAFIEDGVTEIVDHRGKGMVMPGCTDGHSHYTMKFSMEKMTGGVIFAIEDDKNAVLEKVAIAAKEAKDAGKTSLFGFGWNFLALMEDSPTLQELDDVTYGVSTVIFDQGGHHAFCNSECLKRCGIIDGNGGVLIAEIDGGSLKLDGNGYPTGYAEERVTGYLMRMGGINQDEVVDDDLAEASIRATQELLLSTGYTTALEGWSNMLHPSKLYEAANRMDLDGALKIVFPMTYEVEPWQTNLTSEIDRLASIHETYGTAHVLPEYLKLFMDGVVETKTGAMLRPYKDGTTYKSFWSVDRLADITRACNAKGLTVHAHTMGDAAIKETADAYIQGGDGTHRNCLVHLRNVYNEDFKRFADNNIACTAGFTWHCASVEQDEFLSQFLDDEYVYHAYPMKSFFEAGVKVSSHSDFPANEPSPQDPFGIMQVAVTGMVPDPLEGEKPYDTNELITVEQAFQALTLNGAWQLGLENERGSIKVGKYADFVLADQDVFECAAADIGKTKVVSTWFEGEKVYQSPSGRVLEIFEEICAVPRSSANESQIGDWLMQWAEDHGFAAARDTAGGNGNVFIDVPATPGMEGRALVVLQSHQDMVPAVKEGVAHDWNVDPVVPEIEDGWIHSRNHETSLGADDGIGMATALAIAEGGMAHGPLRLIMTVEEETSQIGVQTLDPARVADAKYLINIDSEAEGEVTISSAIGDANRFARTPASAESANEVALVVRVRGLCGGHSGIDIDRGRGNAIVALAGMISNLVGTAGVDLELASFTGGSAQNAIPVSAEAVIVVPASARSVVENAADALQAALRTVADDANATVSVADADLPQRVLAADDRDRLLRLVLELPNGVLSMSPSVPGLVQTSSNLGVLDATPEGIDMAVMVRSSSNEEYEELIAENGQLAEACGFGFSNTKSCEAWPADPDSRLLAICTNVYHTVFGTDMAVVAVHAGLECGTFKRKNPVLDMISIGPTVLSPHSIDEACELDACEKVWTLLEGILAAIPDGVSVTPGVPVVFDTAEAATNAAAVAVLVPSADVAKELTDAEARARYAGSFGFVVNPTVDGAYAVEAVLTDAAKSNLAGNVEDLTRQLPVAALAALADGATLAATATNGVPGFYYSLYDGIVLTNLQADANPANLNVLCGADAEVVFPEVKKPSDASGFFAVGADVAPLVCPGQPAKEP